MRVIRPGDQRGHGATPGVDSRFAFSSACAHDPAWSGFGVLRACNEHRVAPGAAASQPARANMEILTVVLAGTLRNAYGDVAAPGVAWNGAGWGFDAPGCHAADDGPLHVVEAWIQPGNVNLPPAGGIRILPGAAAGAWQVLAAPLRDGVDTPALPLRQQAEVAAIRLLADMDAGFALHAQRRYWLQVLRGRLQCDARLLVAGDGLGISAEAGRCRLHAVDATGCDVLLFDLPG